MAFQFEYKSGVAGVAEQFDFSNNTSKLLVQTWQFSEPVEV
jgi:hypothetical protein